MYIDRPINFLKKYSKYQSIFQSQPLSLWLSVRCGDVHTEKSSMKIEVKKLNFGILVTLLEDFLFPFGVVKLYCAKDCS